MMNDRGSIKWASLMLPEHVEALDDLFHKENEEKPFLSADQLEDMQRNVEIAMQYNKHIDVLYYTKYHFNSVEGTILRITPDRLEIKNDDGADFIPVKDVISLTLLED
ncbi:YolD-like family protein [Gracilibacillus oryzae]|uniref:YolD-like family protein n=1 Tax=Gracilibacillus oryzae TaxID=1672701 RepID=A0A7C8KSL5_9BACI|nr:YolD-like family protein [Gracilibacillus oryzae]KAB8126886.1 YolD-like family protein [Gracilibacillus oryzae]